MENELTPVTSQSSTHRPPERFKWQAGYSPNKTTTGSAQGKKVGMRWTHDDNPATQHNKGKTGANSAPDCLVALRRRTSLTQLVPLHQIRYWDNAAKKKKKASSLSKSRLWRSTAKTRSTAGLEFCGKYPHHLVTLFQISTHAVVASTAATCSWERACPRSALCAMNCVTSTIPQLAPESVALV